MDEKQKIEYETAKDFLKLYNCKFGKSYAIDGLSDAPDVKCKDEITGGKLNLEITLTEDRKGDIQAILGRSNSRDINVMIENGLKSSCLQGEVSQILTQRIQKKLNKTYGKNTALIIRDTSGVPWDWNSVSNELKKSLDLSKNSFDKGIWIINRWGDKIFRIV